jgi:hypothetical protein
MSKPALREPHRIGRPGAPAQWHVGNAMRDGVSTRWWFVGPFLGQAAGIRASDVEIKWLSHSAGDRRAQPVTGETRTTVMILVAGKCQIELDTGSFVLSQPGDYAMWGPGVDHTWDIIDDSTLISVRWCPPSALPDEQNRACPEQT